MSEHASLSSYMSAFNAPGTNKSATNGGGFFGKDGFTMGSLSDILSGFSGIYGAYQGGQGVDLAKEQFALQKGLLETNVGNQANITNAGFADRQDRRNRNAANDGSGQIASTADYLSQFGVSNTVGQTGYQGNNDPVNSSPSPYAPPAARPSDNMRGFGRV